MSGNVSEKDSVFMNICFVCMVVCVCVGHLKPKHELNFSSVCMCVDKCVWMCVFESVCHCLSVVGVSVFVCV